MEQQDKTEQHCHSNPNSGPDGCFLDSNHMVFLVEDTEVKG
jgi:hypothetical protein